MDVAPVFRPERSKYLVITTTYIVPFLITLLVIFLGYLVLFSSFFQISTITCTLDFEQCQDGSVIAELDKYRGQNIFRLKESDLSARLTSGDFTIRRAIISRELPSTLKVELESVYPVVAIAVGGDSTWVVLDHDFRIIATRSANPNVPTVLVTTPQSLTIGKAPTDPVLLDTLSLAIKLRDELISFKTLTLVDADTIKIELESGLFALFTPKQEILPQLRSLQAILTDDTITEGIRTIDVRFAQPVLRP